MRSSSLFAVVAATVVSAIEFTAPTANSTLLKDSTVTLEWTAVDTDPTSFSIYLVNFVNFPPFYTPLAFDVPTTDLSASVRVPCGVDSSFGFQFNAINGTNVFVIYAQTPTLFIEGADCEDPAPPTETCPAAVTVTVTATTCETTTSVPYGNGTTTYKHTTYPTGTGSPSTTTTGPVTVPSGAASSLDAAKIALAGVAGMMAVALM